VTLFVATGRDLRNARAGLERLGVAFAESRWGPGVVRLEFADADWPKVHGRVFA
jgi:hypothetical protein